MAEFYVVRYVAGTPLSRRPHACVVGRWSTWVDAEDARLAQPNAADLEVLEREVVPA